ncbi:hypothetical protein HZZ13_08790 [Bradyrhizobium sp. CNPSo 4010]|uniref:Transposase n=1 Tax=Bradyrhizobium agreste TaxID=2751811 RepID=A0ABS0PL14_9BRAD|nr:hypothetical protein [Bradyrhizobium agreste]MBH5397887.1 hypothetical protein [Bradyrhizobium agreste]
MLTVSALIDEYMTDQTSKYHALSYRVRLNNARYLSRIRADRGNQVVSGITRRMLGYWYKRWSEKGETSGRIFISQLRAIAFHGVLQRDDSDCYRLVRILDTFELPSRPARDVRLTFAHAEAIIERAHFCGWCSMAIGQAFQYELLMKQKDVIGEWVPAEAFKGASDVCHDGKCWTSGIRWEEIDDQFILRHPTKSRERHINVDLKRAPLVMQELRTWAHPTKVGPLLRKEYPSNGPVLICDVTGLPWIASEYRRKWRILADGAGVPKTVKNMDSRAGAKVISIAGRDIRVFERHRPGSLDLVGVR